MLKKYIIIVFALFVVSCAKPPKDEAELKYYNEINDPFEPVNRKIFAFNMGLDKFLIKPVAKGYRYTVPKPARRGVSSFLSNLKEPVNFANCTLQLNFKCSMDSVMRFFFNTVFGLLGTQDVASLAGMKQWDNSFGITLAKYGVPKGPMFVVPVLGQMHTRDIFGAGGDYFMNPVTIHMMAKNPEGDFWDINMFVEPVVQGISTREELLDLTDDVERNSIDLYASYREMLYRVRQKKINDILGQNKEEISPSYDFDIDDDF